MNVAALGQHIDGGSAALTGAADLSFGDLRRRVDLTRTSIAAHIQPGDVVAIAGENSARFVEVLLAALGAGAAVLPVNRRTPAPELERVLAATAPRLLIDCESDEPLPGWSAHGTFIADGATTTPAVERADDDAALLMSTSGTSGTPRIAVLSHGNVVASVEQTIAGAAVLRERPHVIVGVMPLSHVLGLITVTLVSLHLGATLVLDNDLSVPAVVDNVQQHRATVLVAPPVFWFRLAASPPDRSALRTVELALSGSAPLSGAVARSVNAATGLGLRQGYGLTEAASALTTAVGSTAPATSVGRPLPGVELRLVDDFGDDALVGDVGEIWARGANVFSGYLNDQEATAEVLDGDGWLHTGDLAVVDENGHLFIVGRNRDLIIVSGFNVHPSEVESALIEHPAVTEAAVVGQADREHGEAVVAHVVLSDPGAVEPAALIEHCRARLVAYKVPIRVEVAEALPRGATGKLHRRQLR